MHLWDNTPDVPTVRGPAPVQSPTPRVLARRWRDGVPELRAVVTPDGDGSATAPNYGTTFEEADYRPIPQGDLPFGLPPWVGDDSWGRRDTPRHNNSVVKPEHRPRPHPGLAGAGRPALITETCEDGGRHRGDVVDRGPEETSRVVSDVPGRNLSAQVEPQTWTYHMWLTTAPRHGTLNRRMTGRQGSACVKPRGPCWTGRPARRIGFGGRGLSLRGIGAGFDPHQPSFQKRSGGCECDRSEFWRRRASRRGGSAIGRQASFDSAGSINAVKKALNSKH